MAHDNDHQQSSENQNRNLPPLFNKTDSEDFRDLYDLNKLFHGLQRHILLIVTCMGLCGAFGVYITHKLKSTYKAESIVIYQQSRESPETVVGIQKFQNLTLATVLDMIKIPKNLETVKTELGLQIPNSALSSMISVPVPRNDSNLIRIVVKNKNPEMAAKIANALAKASVKSAQDFMRLQMTVVLNGYESQLADTQRKLGGQLQEIEDFKNQNQIFDMDPFHSSFLARIESAIKKKDQANLEHDSVAAQYDALKQQSESLSDLVPISSLNSSGTASPLQTRISTLETALAEAKAKYTANNPKILHLEEQLKQMLGSSSGGSDSGQILEKNPLKERLQLQLFQLQGKVQSSQKIKEEVQGSLTELEKHLAQLPKEQISFLKLLQAKQITESEIKEITKTVEELQLMTSLPKGSIEVYQLAYAPTPWKEGWWVNLFPILGILFGLGLGGFIALILESVDNRICSPKQISIAYSIPCLTAVPEIVDLSNRNGEKRTLFFIRNLAERLERIIKQKGLTYPISIAFTSSLPEEGKSFFSYYLALYYVRLGKKTLFIEADSRPNSLIADQAQTKNNLVKYLQGDDDLNHLIQPGKPDVISCGSAIPSMKELISSDRMTQLWTKLKSKYEIIIVDAPGVIQEDYTTDLIKFADLSIMLIGSTIVTKPTIDQTLERLDSLDTRPCGILLNRINPIYIYDERIKAETKRTNKEFLKDLLFWRK